mgnify:CR=1 FL=1
MDTVMKLAVLALLCAALALFLKKYHGVYGIAMSIGGCCVLGLAVLQLLTPILSFLRELASAASVDSTLLDPLLKSLGIGLLTQYASAACADAGESTLGKLVESGGVLLILGLALPLMTRLLSLIRTMSGG